jgi:cytochrome c556
MRASRVLSSSLVLAGLTAVVLVGCATVAKSQVGSGDVIADRQRLMKLNGASWQDAQAKAKAGNVEAIRVNAETMALNARHISVLFPAGSLTDKSAAKPEIWQKWDEFQKAAQNMETWAVRLRDAAASKDAQATEAVMKDFGRQACGSCHTPFRVPPKQ